MKKKERKIEGPPTPEEYGECIAELDFNQRETANQRSTTREENTVGMPYVPLWVFSHKEQSVVRTIQ